MNNWDLKFEIVKNIDKYFPGKTINDITQKEKIEIDGVIYYIGSFLSEQRKIHAKYEKLKENGGKLDPKVLEHFRMFDELGFDWDPKESDWKFKFDALIDYCEKNECDVNVANSCIHVYEGKKVPIGVFVTNQRVVYRKYVEDKVKKDDKILKHFKLLEERGMEWSPQENDFNKKFGACKFYFETTGNKLDFTSSFIVNYNGEEIDIGTFIANQRSLYNKYNLGSINRGERSVMLEHFKMLEEIGMDWDPMETQWMWKYSLLQMINEKDGNLDKVNSTFSIEVDGKNVNLGLFLDDQREMYKKYRDVNNNELDEKLKKRFSLLEDLGVVFEPREEYWKKRFDLCCQYKEEFGNVNISNDYQIILDGEVINLGKFLAKQRELYRKYEKNNFKDCPEYLIRHFKLFNELGVSWNPQKDEFIKQYSLLRKYYEIYGNIDIENDYFVSVDGKEYNLKQVARNIKEAMSKRKEEILDGSADLEIMNRYFLLKDIGFKFTNPIDMILYDDGTGKKRYTRKELAKKLDIVYSTFNKYLKRFNGNVTKTVRICEMNKKLKADKKGRRTENYNLSNIMEAFDVNLDVLDGYLKKKVKKDKIERVSEVVMYSGDVSLRKYCIDHGYNYNIVIRALRLKQKELVDEDLETIINRVLIDYNKRGQNRPPSWIYSKYGNEVLVSHFLTSLNLDATAILRDMGSNCITIEEAIENNVFKMMNRKKQDYLEGLYHNIVSRFNELNVDSSISEEEAINSIVNYVVDVVNEFHLSKEEFDLVVNCFYRYVSTINEYHIFDVGFEKNEKKKIEKINKYMLDEDEIKQSFFVHLRFDEKVLIGEDSELYKRRYLLKSLMDNWDRLDPASKSRKKEELGLTSEEEYYLNEFSNKFDEIKEKIGRKL